MPLKPIGADPGANGVVSLYGDGRDGTKEITRSEALSGQLRVNSFTVMSGATLAIDRGLTIFARDSIKIRGKVDGYGRGGTGGHGADGEDGGAFDNSKGTAGESSYFPLGSGGDGGPRAGNSTHVQQAKGGGSYTDLLSDEQANRIVEAYNPFDWEKIIGGSFTAGHGGGGGGGGATDSYSRSVIGGNGGNGGNGGAGLLLVAPEIVIEGAVDLRGEDGNRGSDANSRVRDAVYGDDATNGGSGGGGGSGGTIILLSPNIVNNGRFRLGGGLGGAPGSGILGGTNGNYGEDGANGEVHEITT